MSNQVGNNNNIIIVPQVRNETFPTIEISSSSEYESEVEPEPKSESEIDFEFDKTEMRDVNPKAFIGLIESQKEEIRDLKFMSHEEVVRIAANI
jgi:predicted regulator of Ras-like GTPase activity (Roadblock/LC7/MglB family)